MVANGLWQGLLNALGWVLAWIYHIVPNYGIAIVLLTLAIRLLLLPLGIKQIKSMQHMQALQPKLKELQKKYKNNRQKQQEEQKIYEAVSYFVTENPVTTSPPPPSSPPPAPPSASKRQG